MEIDLREYASQLKNKYGIKDKDFNFELTKLLINNDWYGMPPVARDGKVYVDDAFVERNSEKFDLFCRHYNDDLQTKTEILLSMLNDSFPDTAGKFRQFSVSDHINGYIYAGMKNKDGHLNNDVMFHLSDCMLKYLSGEIVSSTDKELRYFLEDAAKTLIKAHMNILCDFISWIHGNYKTTFSQVFFVETEVTENKSSEAYDLKEYCDIIYHLYNEEYIQKNDMYRKAADSKQYIDTWLFLAIFCVCSLRLTDVRRIPHPKLSDKPEIILQKIRDGAFTDAEAVAVLNTVVWELQFLALTPNKTKKTSNGETIRIVIPHSVETHLGTLFAIAEAHFLLSGKNADDPLIERISSYRLIKRYMGDEISDLFKDSDFRVRSANKSFLQAIQFVGNQDSDCDSLKGYMLASFARSHKASFGSFSRVIDTYLKDAKMSGLTADVVGKELAERGVLSSITSTLLSIISNGEYRKLSISHQTDAIKELNLTPSETESVVSIYEENRKQSIQLAHEIYSNNTKENVLRILHNIATGVGASKRPGSGCMLAAMGKLCPYETACSGCKYEIGTVSTLLCMKNELYRLKSEYQKADNDLDRSKAKYLATHVVAPALQELMTCYELLYGPGELKRLELLLKEDPSQLPTS